MKAEIIAAAIREDTSPTVYSLPSMKNLLLFISAAPGPHLPRQMSGAVGLYNFYLTRIANCNRKIFSFVNCCLSANLETKIKSGFNTIFSTLPAFSRAYDFVNISGTYRGNEQPIPGGTYAPVSYCRSERDITLRERRLAWQRV